MTLHIYTWTPTQIPYASLCVGQGLKVKYLFRHGGTCPLNQTVTVFSFGDSPWIFNVFEGCVVADRSQPSPVTSVSIFTEGCWVTRQWSYRSNGYASLFSSIWGRWGALWRCAWGALWRSALARRNQAPTGLDQSNEVKRGASLMTPTTNLGLSILLSMFELRETGDWDIFHSQSVGSHRSAKMRLVMVLNVWCSSHVGGQVHLRLPQVEQTENWLSTLVWSWPWGVRQLGLPFAAARPICRVFWGKKGDKNIKQIKSKPGFPYLVHWLLTRVGGHY